DRRGAGPGHRGALPGGGPSRRARPRRPGRGRAGGVGAGMRSLVALCLLAGCLVTPTQRREETLVREAREFNDDIRWGRYEQLYLSLPPEEAALMSSRAAALGDDLVVGDYE